MFPETTPAFMQYIETIRKLGQRAGDEAALFYDFSFRFAVVSWSLNCHLAYLRDFYKEILAMGLSTRHKQFTPKSCRTFRSTSKTASNTLALPCYSFNNTNGKCIRQ